MIYDDMKSRNIDELEMLIYKLREKLSSANDRLVLWEAEADVHFMRFCDAQDEVESLRREVELYQRQAEVLRDKNDTLRSKNKAAVNFFKSLLYMVEEVSFHLPSSVNEDVKALKNEFSNFHSTDDDLPF